MDPYFRENELSEASGVPAWMDGLLCSIGRSPDSVDDEPMLVKEKYTLHGFRHMERISLLATER